MVTLIHLYVSYDTVLCMIVLLQLLEDVVRLHSAALFYVETRMKYQRLNAWACLVVHLSSGGTLRKQQCKKGSLKYITILCFQQLPVLITPLYMLIKNIYDAFV